MEASLEDVKSSGKKKKESANEIDNLTQRMEKHNWHLEKLSELRDKLQARESFFKKARTRSCWAAC